MKNVLLVDNDTSLKQSMANALKSRGHLVSMTSSLAEARIMLQQQSFDVLLIELYLRDGNGIELLAEIGDTRPSQVVMTTGNRGFISAVRGLEGPGVTFLPKPFHIDKFLSLILQTPLHDLEEGEQALHSGLLVGKSESMQRTYELVRQVAVTDTTVLINGESGTGKELVAQAIHRESGRYGRFVAVNCGALSSELLGSELFGHEKGSFTGANRRHVGLFEQAEHGTLFLDEITEMPLEQQPHLLRALESGRITPVGAEREINTYCRIIAASNRDLGEAIEAGLLREDLYYRLSIFPIAVAPLRERHGDIELLAKMFLRELNDNYDTSKTLCADGLDKLGCWYWPGNVRELKHSVQRSYIRTPGVDQALQFPENFAGGMLAGRVRPGFEGRSIEDVEREHILSTLDLFGGNKKRTASALGVSLKTLYNRIAAYQQDGASAGT